jgi:hypothetical protein
MDERFVTDQLLATVPASHRYSAGGSVVAQPPAGRPAASGPLVVQFVDRSARSAGCHAPLLRIPAGLSFFAATSCPRDTLPHAIACVLEPR